jgi:hypothetical protein
MDSNLWNDVCTTWGTTCNLWGQCVAEVVEEVFGGARNPQEWHDPPFYEELEKYQEKFPDKKDILIKIYIKCVNKKYEHSFKLPDKKVNIDVDDIKFILNTLKEVGVDIKNIRRYTDDDLRTLLS